MTVFEETDAETLKSQQYIYEGNLLDQTTEVSYRNLAIAFIKQLRPGMDISRIQAPIEIMKPKSYLQMTSEYVYPTEDLLKVVKEKDPAKRMRIILSWYMGNLKMTAQKGYNKVKPFNPVIGEKFLCKFEHDDGSVSDFRAEQVSHHPPISASMFKNQKHNISYTATTAPKTTFWGNRADMLLDGEHVFHVHDLDEHYEITLPPITMRGIILGSSVVEHSGSLRIVCQKTHCVGEVIFKKKALNAVEGFIMTDNTKVMKFDGMLDAKISMVDIKTKTETLFYDPSLVKKVKRVVRPVCDQADNESQRVWHASSFCIVSNDTANALEHKHIVEERQRKLAKERKERNEEWVPEDFLLTGIVTATGVPLYQLNDKLSTPIVSLELEENDDLD